MKKTMVVRGIYGRWEANEKRRFNEKTYKDGRKNGDNYSKTG